MKKIIIHNTILCLIFSAHIIHASEMQQKKTTQQLAAQRLIIKQLTQQHGIKAQKPSTQDYNTILQYDASNKNLFIPQYNKNLLIDTYQLSPQKKYLITQGEEIKEPGYFPTWDKFKNFAATAAQTIADKFGIDQNLKSITTTIYPLHDQSLQKIIFFENVITYAFNHDESLLLISTSQPASAFKKRSSKHQGLIVVKKTDIFSYHLIDTIEKKELENFENVSTISFDPKSSDLYITFNDNTLEKIFFGKKRTKTMFDTIIKWISNYIEKKQKTELTPTKKTIITDKLTALPESIASLPGRVHYDFYQNNKLEIINSTSKTPISRVQSYQLSPQNNYVIAMIQKQQVAKSTLETVTALTKPMLNNQNPNTLELISTKTGTPIALPENQNNSDIVTYQFSPDETKLLLLQPISNTNILGSKMTQYYLFDIASQKIIETYPENHTISFKSDTELYQINNTTKLMQEMPIKKAPTTTIKQITQGIEELKKGAKETLNSVTGFFTPQKKDTPSVKQAPENITTLPIKEEDLKNIKKTSAIQEYQQTKPIITTPEQTSGKPKETMAIPTVITPTTTTATAPEQQIIEPIAKPLEQKAKEALQGVEENWEKAKKQWEAWKPWG